MQLTLNRASSFGFKQSSAAPGFPTCGGRRRLIRRSHPSPVPLPILLLGLSPSRPNQHCSLLQYGNLQITRWDITQMGECASLMAAGRWAGRAHRHWWWRRHSPGRKAVPLWDSSGEEWMFIGGWGGRDMAELVLMFGSSSWVGLDK